MNSLNNKTYSLTPEHRERLCQVLNDLNSDQLRLVLTNYLKNSSISNKFQTYTHLQLYQQCLILIDNYYSTELEQALYAMRQKQFSTDFYQQQQQQQQQPNFHIPFNQQTNPYNQLAYRFPPSPAISQQLRSIRPNPTASHSTTSLNPRPQQSLYNPSLLAQQQQHQQQIRLASPSTNVIQNTPATPIIQRYQVPLLPPPSYTSIPSSSHQPLILPSTNNSQRSTINKILHKILPFYRTITSVYERYYIFHYDQYRKQYISHNEFILSFDVCNQLALSYDYDSTLNVHKTNKCLLLRLARIDQPPTFNGKYDDNLPPNLVIHVNGHALTNLPIPKASTRQQNDLIRIGREIDITSYCMFNPMLKNEIKLAWSYRQDNTSLHMQYVNAQYALHIFLVEHLTVDNLCEQIKKKPMKFHRGDLIQLLLKARAHDYDLGLEVSDQKLKLICPIDHRRLKIPVRATTCQHLQCFDLANYIALNEKSNKWICPVCNKLALFEDLQIDSYTETILNSIEKENISEITINGNLDWTPVFSLDNTNQFIKSESNIHTFSSSNDVIYLDDDN